VRVIGPHLARGRRRRIDDDHAGARIELTADHLERLRTIGEQDAIGPAGRERPARHGDPPHRERLAALRLAADELTLSLRFAQLARERE
jgi:hypothetical protein